MKKSLILIVLSALMNASAVSAQIVDMRAYSLQRGFKAYEVKSVQKQTVPVRPKYVNEENGLYQTKKMRANEEESIAEINGPADQTDEIQKYIAENPQVKPDI